MSSDRTDVWYAEGLQFSCTQCGNCCTGSPGYVWVDEDEQHALAEHLGVSIGEFRLLHTRRLGARMSLREYPNGDCTFFDPETRRCRVYEARPRQCRTWPFWPSHLESPAHWQAVGKECPGAGCGTLHPLETIEAMRIKSDLRL